MSVSIKSPEELDIIREGGKHLAWIVRELSGMVVPGVSDSDIDARARELIAEIGGESSFLGYRPHGVKTPYPAAVCISINDEIVHGIPASRVIHEGSVVTVDCGLKYRGFFTDHAVSVIAGQGSAVDQKLVDTTYEAMMIGIDAIVPGCTNLDPGIAIENFVAGRYGIVRELAGHGVGYAVHEDPYIPNFRMKGRSVPLAPGMVVAVEPMLTIGPRDVYFLDDDYTVVTQSGNRAAHFEHTVIVTDTGAEIVTL